MTTWRDKTWLITGASTGFGRAAARMILESGGRVIATARDPAALADLAAAYPDTVLPLALDVTQPEQIDAVIRRADAWGGADVLLNNAGYGFLGGVEESTQAEIDAQMGVNFFGPLNMIRAVLPALRKRDAGFIVNMSSISGARGYEGAGFYAASKFALEGLSEALADEVAQFGIGVLVVEPGYFRTDFSTRSLQMAAAAHPDYPHLAQRRARVAGAKRTEPGDPRRAIAAILSAIESPSPPRRLVLGKDAYGIVGDVLRKRSDELEAWKDLTRSTDFED